MSDRDALLAAIRANPRDDAPRLIMADWLDEHNEPELAQRLRLGDWLAPYDDPIFEQIQRIIMVTQPSSATPLRGSATPAAE